jgi:hypothetical protein
MALTVRILWCPAAPWLAQPPFAQRFYVTYNKQDAFTSSRAHAAATATWSMYGFASTARLAFGHLDYNRTTARWKAVSAMGVDDAVVFGMMGCCVLGSLYRHPLILQCVPRGVVAPNTIVAVTTCFVWYSYTHSATLDTRATCVNRVWSAATYTAGFLIAHVSCHAVHGAVPSTQPVMLCGT